MDITAVPHSGCRLMIWGWWASRDVEVTVSDMPPLVESPWTQSVVCPHGTTYHYEPTSDQRAAWARDGVH